jgi:hypothetical protein
MGSTRIVAFGCEGIRARHAVGLSAFSGEIISVSAGKRRARRIAPALFEAPPSQEGCSGAPIEFRVIRSILNGWAFHGRSATVVICKLLILKYFKVS